MPSMAFTFDTSHFERSQSNDSAEWNMRCMFTREELPTYPAMFEGEIVFCHFRALYKATIAE